MAALPVAQDVHGNSLKAFNEMRMQVSPFKQLTTRRHHYCENSLHLRQADPAVSSSDTMQHRLQVFLSKHLRERVTLKDLSSFLGYSQKYCSEFFRLQMGVSFSHYVKNLRITRATVMLTDHDLPLSHIAELLGFSDSFAFSHFFKRAVGCSPSEFRKHRIVQLGFR